MKNLNDLARELCALEGKRKQLPIGQVKEVLRCLCKLFATHPFTVVKLLARGAEKHCPKS